jgi:hypothetical protein
MVMFSLLCGCKSSEFAAMHSSELQKDCSETLRCGSGALQSTTANALEDCVNAAGDQLDAAGAPRQQLFIDTVNRCGQLQICDYLSCTASDPNSGWAAMNQNLIVHDCQQAIGCRIAGGQQQPASAVNDCVSQQSNALNFGTPQMQAALVLKGMRCMAQTNCAWVSCM